MKKFLAIWLMFFGTATMAENITLVCNPTTAGGQKQYIRFNDEEQTITAVGKEAYLTNDWYENVVHWSDKIILFSSRTSPLNPPKNTYFNVSLSALDRVKGLLQRVYVNHQYFDKEKKGQIFLYECELHDREKPKF